MYSLSIIKELPIFVEDHAELINIKSGPYGLTGLLEASLLEVLLNDYICFLRYLS